MANGMRIDPKLLPLHMQEQVAMAMIPQKEITVDRRFLIKVSDIDLDMLRECAEDPKEAFINKIKEYESRDFRAGQAARTEQIVNLMMEYRTHVKGVQHALLTDLIEKVRRL